MYLCGALFGFLTTIMTHLKFLLSFLVLFTACAQHQDDVDQVHQLIAEAEQKYEVEDLSSVWALLDSALIVAERNNSAVGQAEVLLNMSYIHYSMDQLDSVLFCLNRGLELCPNAPDSLLALYYSELTTIYINKGDMQSAVEWAGRTFPLIRRYGDDEEFAIFCGNAGVAYRKMGQKDSAVVYYERGLERAVRTEDYASEAFLANNLSVLFAQDRRLEESMLYADKAYQAAVQAEDDVERISALANKGEALSLGKHYREAIDLLSQAFREADSLKSTPLKLKTIGYLLNALAEDDEATDVAYYLQRSDELVALLPPENANAAGILGSKINILIKRKRYAEALQSIGEVEKLMEGYEIMAPHHLLHSKAQCLAGLGRYKEAYELQIKSSMLRDSVQTRDSETKLDELSTNYRVMEKELEVAQLNEKQALSKRRISQLIAVLAVLLAIIAILLLWIRQRRQRAQIHEAQRYIDGIEQERTRFAHELHDGACNELLAMGMQLRATNPDIPEVCQQMSTLRSTLRNLSHELMPPQFNQGVKLNEALAYYLSHIEKPVVTFHAEGDGWATIPNNVSYQLYRIVQEAIGNIIVHQPEAKADVSLISTDGTLELVVTSTGEVKKGESKGIGMQSMRDRANSIGGALSVEQKKDVWSLKLSV